MNLNVPIGQRLGIGFGLLTVVLGVFAAAMYVWHANSVRAQREFVEQVAPLEKQAGEVERALLTTGLDVRAYLMTPDGSRLERVRRQVDAAADAMDRLGQLPKSPAATQVYRRVTTLVQTYLESATRLVELRRSGETELADAEADLAEVRDLAMAGLRQLIELQEREADAIVTAMADARDKVSAGLTSASFLAILLFIAIGYFTTQSIRRPTRQLVSVATAMQAGDWRPALQLAQSAGKSSTARSEMRKLADTFGSVATVLERRERRLRADHEVLEATASSLERDSLAVTSLRSIVGYLRAEVAVIYWRDPDTGTLHPVARHALSPDAPPVRPGEGIPGQAAEERRAVLIRDIPRDSPFSVKIGYDQSPPRAVAAIPICFASTVHGVLLAATLRDFDSDDIEFMEAAASRLGTALQNAAAYEQIQRLLGELRESNQQIQSQNQELQAQNEEIQAQSEEIQSQSEELQAQHTEIQEQNEALRKQSEELRDLASTLAEADERKNQFLGVLAHELRNPLAPITNSLVILKRTPPGSEQWQRAQAVIERQTRHLTRLIDDLLDITRISQGKIRLQRERIDLVEVVRTCVEDQRAVIEGRRITLNLVLPSTPVLVEGDHTRLSQVLGNLLNNSTKFTDQGGRISLALSFDHAAGQAVLRVADNGIGMDPALIPLLFQPFSQGATSLARTNGGLGLGLALVKALVELHHGTVEARSEGPAKGSEFVVRLPLLRVEATPITRHREPSAHHTPRVLLIEDNIDAAQSLREMIQLDGHAVKVAHSGLEGLEIAQSFQPDLVLCDIGLPTLDGYELARKFREDPTLKSMYLVALTGYAAQNDKERAASAGFDLHLAKPISPERLSEILGHVANGRRLAKA